MKNLFYRLLILVFSLSLIGYPVHPAVQSYNPEAHEGWQCGLKLCLCPHHHHGQTRHESDPANHRGREYHGGAFDIHGTDQPFFESGYPSGNQNGPELSSRHLKSFLNDPSQRLFFETKQNLFSDPFTLNLRLIDLQLEKPPQVALLSVI